MAEISEEYTTKVPTTPETFDFSRLDPELTKNLDPKLLDVLKKSALEKGNMAELEKALGKNKTDDESAPEATEVEVNLRDFVISICSFAYRIQ